MNEPIRVLQIIGDVVGGGVENVIMNYYRYIDKSKIQFDFVVHEGALETYLKEIKKYGGNVFVIPSYKTNIFKYTYAIYKIIKENKYSIVHSNMNSMSGFPLMAAYFAGAKIRILHNHTTDSPAEGIRTLLKRILRPFAKLFANQYWACSNLAAEWMYGKKVVEENKITIINNAIDIDKFKFDKEKREKIREKLCLKDCFVIGHVGRFEQTKNHKFLINVFHKIIKQIPSVKLLLVGDGSLKDEIQLQVENLGLKSNVIFCGVRNDVADLYNAMDVFVFPSLYEGLGMAVIEAQVNSLPTIVSIAIPAEAKISEYIKFISLQQPLKDWLNEVENAKRKELNISDELLKKFDIKQECKKLENLYLKLIKGRVEHEF